MFSQVSNSSKAALIFLSKKLEEKNFLFIDCQVYTKHLETMGATSIPRNQFTSFVKQGLQFSDLKGNWKEEFDFSFFTE